MLLENKKFAIIDGSPGGLTLARLLQLPGVDGCRLIKRRSYLEVL